MTTRASIMLLGDMKKARKEIILESSFIAIKRSTDFERANWLEKQLRH
jgi:hypothetical protein